MSKKSPGMLTVISVIAILLGCLGMFTVLISGASLLFTESIQQFSSSMMPPTAPPEFKDKLDTLNKQALLIQEQWKVTSIILILVHAVVCAFLIWGGIQIFRNHPSGRKLLLKGFLLAIILELVSLYPAYMTMSATMDMQKKFYGEMSDTMPGSPLPMKGIMQASMVASMVIAFGLVFLEIVYYLFGTWYLRKPNIIALLEGDVPIDIEFAPATEDNPEANPDDDLLV